MYVNLCIFFFTRCVVSTTTNLMGYHHTLVLILPLTSLRASVCLVNLFCVTVCLVL